MIYLLLKVHKKNNPDRPIINNSGSTTETLSSLVDETLRHYAHYARYVKDTTHILQIIKDLEVQQNDLICTVDMSSLYTNIAHKDTAFAVRTCLERHNLDLTEISLTVELLQHILTQHYWSFICNTKRPL